MKLIGFALLFFTGIVMLSSAGPAVDYFVDFGARKSVNMRRSAESCYGRFVSDVVISSYGHDVRAVCGCAVERLASDALFERLLFTTAALDDTPSLKNSLMSCIQSRVWPNNVKGLK